MIKQNAIGTKHEWDTLEREAACVRFLLRTKEVNTGTAVYSKYVLGRYLKELFEIPAFDYWQQYSGVQTAEQCKRDLQLFSLPLKRVQNRLSGWLSQSPCWIKFFLNKENSSTSWSKIIVNSTSF